MAGEMWTEFAQGHCSELEKESQNHRITESQNHRITEW